MLCLKKRRTYSFTQGVCGDLPRRSKKDNRHGGSLNMAITTLPRKNRRREERPSRMVLTVTEDTPADMLAGSMELLVHLPRDNHLQTQRVMVQRSTPMMDLLVQIATAHKLAASNYTLQAIGERGLILPHQPNTPIGALDALQVKLLPKQGTFVPRKTKQVNQPFETTFRLQVHLPRNQLYVSRVSPKMILGDILDEVCREKNLDRNKYELRHPANLEETLDLSLSLQDYHIQEVTLYAKQGRTLGSALSSQDIMALQRQEDRRRQQARQGVFGFVFKKSKEGSLSTDSLGGRSASPARSDETGRSASPLQPPARPQRKRRPAPKPPTSAQAEAAEEDTRDSKDKIVISHSRNSSDSSGYHEASVLSDNPDSAGRLPETLPRRSRPPAETPRKLAQTSESSKSLGNLATVSGTLTHGISCTSLSSAGLRKKRVAPPPPAARPLSSAISTQALERIVDSEESLTSDMEPSKPPSDIGASSKANSDIDDPPKASSDIGVTTHVAKISQSLNFPASQTSDLAEAPRTGSIIVKMPESVPVAAEPAPNVEPARVIRKRAGEPVPKPRKAGAPPQVPKRRVAPVSSQSRPEPGNVDCLRASASSVRDGERTTESELESAAEQAIEILENALNAGDVNYERSESPKRVGPVPANVEPVLANLEPVPVNLESVPANLEPVPTNLEPVPATVELEKTSPPSETERQTKTTAKQDVPLCAVISTVPKCEHLDIQEQATCYRNRKPDQTSDSVDLKDDLSTQIKGQDDVRDFKRSRVIRSVSKANFFEVNSLEKQKRHLTSDAEDITFALNLNLSTNVDLLADLSKPFEAAEKPRPDDARVQQETDPGTTSEEIAHRGLGIADVDQRPSETDILLQKVSDTLSNSLDSNEVTSLPETHVAAPETAAVVSERTERPKDTTIKEEPLKGALQQSDFTDGSILNASTPNLTLSSQQDTSDYVSAVDDDLSIADWEYQLPAPPSAFRDTASPALDGQEPKPAVQEARTQPEVKPKADEAQRTRKPTELDLQKSDSLKKEIICELENKIGSLPQAGKDLEFRRVVDSSSTPQVAPVDNTLANFTITTYTRQKSLNIFAEAEEKPSANPDERFVRSFATLSRNRSSQEGEANLNDSVCKKSEPKMQERSVQRSKSSACDKFRGEAREARDDVTDGCPESAANSVPRSNEKFSQWRENILKRQEEPTKEKQLQSLQVLKSILPQLKSAQQAEENVSKEPDVTVLVDKTRSETAPNEHSSALAARDHQPEDKEPKKPLPESNAPKRYTYSGPPTVSLGSWSERPSVNVQIKMDTDYKFGISNRLANRTVVSLNGAKDERDQVNPLTKREPGELTRKLITHTTATGFKKPLVNSKPVVTGVELKKSAPETNSVVDTSPVNFKELTKAFGQDVILRPKPQRSNVRHSEYYGQTEPAQPEKNGHAESRFSEPGDPRPKRFTTIVGIHPQAGQAPGGFSFRNGVASQPMPVVKGFKIQPGGGQAKQNGLRDPQPPRPPTMPVITGVTLKNSRPKSMPVQVDPRDTLLESIRNFGGRGNLKSATQRR